jgi:UDP-N-acetylglucosamine 2-epimerase (non-hydrolysing)
VLPLHPRTRHSLDNHGLRAELDDTPGLHLVDPMGYLEFIGLVDGARAVVTDSGGIQEETTYLGVPCLTMRENTERPVTVDIGSNKLIGSNRDKLLSALDQELAGQGGEGKVPDLWDGQAAVRIVNVLRTVL